MRRFLLFDLHGAIASWGRVTRGEHRMSWRRPSKSAVLGLVGAALGVKRRDSTEQDRLAKELGFAVRVDQAGAPLMDYQTAESRDNKGPRSVPTRRDTLRQFDEEKPQIKHKEYLCNHAAVVALWERDAGGGDLELEALGQALESPTFTTYLGRKACPPTAPFRPRIVEAEDVGGALLDGEDGPFPPYWPDPEFVQVYWESDWTPEETEVESHEIHDDPLGGPLRTFDGRDEQYATFEVEA